MKKLILLILPVLFIFASCNNSGEVKKDQLFNPDQLVEIQISVEGMTCGGCENTVNTELIKLDGVLDAKASHLEKLVIVSVDTNVSSVRDMEACISKVGYTVINP